MKLAKSAGIIARSDAAWVQFGCGLPEDELKYLHALTKKILAGRRFSPPGFLIHRPPRRAILVRKNWGWAIWKFFVDIYRSFRQDRFEFQTEIRGINA
jgi:hypothetical protein